MRVTPDAPIELLCTYWGGETGQRTFDILVEGQLVATETLNRDQPGKFFERAYPVPRELTRDKQQVEVRFRAHPDNMAGGLYGLRVLKGRP